MATFYLTEGTAENQADSGGTMPVLQGNSLSGATALTTAASEALVQRDGADFEATGDTYLTMRASGGAVWVAIGSSPTAAAGVELWLADGERYTCSAQSGDKVSVIDA